MSAKLPPQNIARTDLEKIFSEILGKFRADKSNAEIRYNVSGYSFVFFHNRLQSYSYSEEHKELCTTVCNRLDLASNTDIKINPDFFFPQYLAELVTTNISPEHFPHFDAIMTNAITNEINCIMQWYQSRNREVSVSLLLNSDFKIEDEVDGWHYAKWDRRDLALASYRSGIGPETFYHNNVDAFWLQKKFEKLIPRADLVNQLSILRLSLSLSVKERLLIHDVKIEHHNWPRCPYVPGYFMKMWGHIEEHRTDLSATRFFMTGFGSQNSGPSFSHERVLDKHLYDKWKVIISNDKYRSAFHHLLNGLADILKSTNYGGYNENFITSDGLTKIFIGLDGMLADKSNRRANTRAFKNFWYPIFSRVVSPMSKNKTERLYALRSALLHGDYLEFLAGYPSVYKIICPKSDISNPAIQHFAFNFAAFIFRTILAIESDFNVLSGPQPKKSLWKQTLNRIKMRLKLDI